MSMDEVLHLHEFFIEGGDPNKSHVLLNITEPATPEEKAKGYFFAICEINNGNSAYIAKVQDIIDELENNYYEVPDQEEKTSLELVLDKINTDSFALIKPDTELNCLVGAIRGSEIIFSFYGNPQIILFYQSKDGEYKKIDLLKENIEYGEEGKQLFTQIIQGKIGPNDYVFAGTPHIAQYFNHDRLQKIITSRPPLQSAEHLQRVMSELRNSLSFGGIIMHMQKPALAAGEPRIKTQVKGDSARSLHNLFNTEKSTAQILSPSFLPRMQEKTYKEQQLKNTSASDSRFPSAQINASHLRQHQNARPSAGKIDAQTIIKGMFKYGWIGIKKIGTAIIWLAVLIKSFILGTGRVCLHLFYLITNYRNRRQLVLSGWRKKWNDFKNNIANLPLITKLLLVVSVILAVIFAGSLEYLNINRKKEDALKTYNQTVQNITAKKDAAESAVIYNDTAIAFKQVDEAKQLLKDLPCRTDAEKTVCQNFQNQLEGILTKIRRVTIVKPALLADWSENAPGMTRLFAVGKKIFGFAANSTTLVSYDLLTKENKTLSANLSVPGFTTAAVPKENDYVLFEYGNNEVAQFNPEDNSWKKIDIGYPNQNASIAALTIYNRRLYTLDAQSGQVYKHDVIKTGFAQGKEWLKNADAGLKNGIDLAIDGDLFILGNDGKISKFTSGAPQPFSVQGLDPALTSANEIWTYTDLDYIYILDSSNKRLLVLDKIGQLKSQITAEEFSNPTGMAVDEQKSTAYILDSNRLFQINLK